MDPEGSLSHSQKPATSPLGCTEGSVRLQRFCDFSVTWLSFHGEELLAPCPTSKLEDRPLSAVRDCLFKVFAATLHIWRPFLHPQPTYHGQKHNKKIICITLFLWTRSGPHKNCVGVCVFVCITVGKCNAMQNKRAVKE